MLWFSTLGITLLALFFALQLPPPDARQELHTKQPQLSTLTQEPAKEPAKEQSDTSAPSKAKHNIRAKINSAPKSKQVYEERLGNDLENKIREIDLALLQAMITSGLGPSRLKHQDVQNRRANGRIYHYQTLDLMIPGDFNDFIRHLYSELAQLVQNASLQRFSAKAPIWEISTLGYPTHLLLLNSDSRSPAPQQTGPAKKNALLAIVIDDLGENLHQAQKLVQGLDIPVTLSVLPFSTRSKEVSELAAQAGQDILLHLPLEPKGFPDIDPGPGALFVNMPREQLVFNLEQDLARIPKAIGVNNHMGSEFTEHAQSLRPVFSELKKRNLFFLDSLTTPRSKVQKIAAEMGLNYMSRHIFLDNEQDVQAIIFQLQKAERIALSNGRCIAIGHPYPETLTALAKWAKKRSSQVQVVKLSSLL